MTRRSPGFIGLMTVMAAISVIPQILWAIGFGREWYRIGRPPVLAKFSDVMSVGNSPFESAVWWQGRICTVTPPAEDKGHRRIKLHDPADGTSTDPGVEFLCHQHLHLLGDGDDLWAFGHAATWHIRGERVEKIDAPLPNGIHLNRVLLDKGVPTFCHEQQFYVLRDGAWSVSGTVALAAEDERLWERVQNTNFIAIDDRLHLMREQPGKILYYESVVFQPDTTTTLPDVVFHDSIGNTTVRL